MSEAGEVPLPTVTVLLFEPTWWLRVRFPVPAEPRISKALSEVELPTKILEVPDSDPPEAMATVPALMAVSPV